MSARVGADDVDPFESPRPRLLREITGLDPEPKGVHVLLDCHGVRSVQRLALADVGGAIVVAFWPAELKYQADYLYGGGRAEAMINAARERGWHVAPSPHLAFFNSRASQRLYMDPDLDPAEYARRWEGVDGGKIGQHSAAEVRQSLWPWLKERGYVRDSDDRTLDEFLKILGKRNAHLRPGMRFVHRWGTEATSDCQTFVRTVRADVDAIFDAAGEPPLPTSL
jgi:hypothetical protein